MYLSDNIMLTTESYHGITLQNGYNVKNFSFMQDFCFDCDKDDNIYVIVGSKTFTEEENTQIYIYSPDLENIGAFSIQKLCCPVTIRIQEDNMVVMCSKLQPHWSKILRYSLSTKELLQTVKFNSAFFQITSRLFLCFDPLDNLIIGCDKPGD
ncbi:hypothetical protein LOD99_12611 [Oopsacas minuta]|uniref:Uncharacterized protein n=1 Tax=Oopsacas minuta TaxID=111878 RepID=A0AAV7JDD8_9METZ|nr:hypothetical protein LOD99_12611 [Oopsacas minuta]